MTVEQVISDFRQCLGWPYVSPGGTGKDCSRSGIDCSGMFVRAYKLHGAQIYHGSNRIWRKHLSSKGKLTSASQLKAGMAVFKWKDRYTTYHDGLGDFHHIGLVCSVNPVEIIHASSAAGKVTTDTSIKNWTHWGVLTEVPVDHQDGPAQANNQRTVTAESGETVFIRYKPSRKMKYVARVPVGAIVDVLSESGEWSLIEYNGKTGYMMTKFLK